MAENETLHLGDKRNRRWRHLCDGVLKGGAAEDTAERAVRCVTSVMKNILRFDPVRGGPEYPFVDLLVAMEKGPSEVAEVLARCGGHEYAHLLAEEAGGADRESVLNRHFGRVVGNFMDQIGLEAVPERFKSFPEFQAFRAEVERQAAPQLRDLAKQIAANPTRPPRRAAQTKGERDAAHVTILTESLLPRSGVRL